MDGLVNAFRTGREKEIQEIMRLTSRVSITGMSMACSKVSRIAVLAIVGGLMAGACVGQPPAASPPAASLTIQLDRPVHAVSPTLYGLMTEEINYSYDGGLYAEMVRNRTFQDHSWDGVARWNIEEMGNAIASMAADLTDGPSAALEHSLAITVKQADAANQAGVRNEGYWGMAVRPNTTYKG